MIELLAASVLIMLASLAGVLTVWGKAGAIVEKNLDYLTSLSAGVFLVVAYHLAEETLEHAESAGAGLVWILAGALFIWLAFKLLPSAHHHARGHEHQGHTIDPRRLLISDGLHNIGDGLVLAAAFMASTTLGFAAAVSIFIHELVQEVSEFFVLREGGYSTRRALTYNFLVSSTILIGAVGGFFLLDLFEVVEVPLLGLAAGAFLVVVLGDLIPHSLRSVNGRFHILKHMGWFALGALLMAGVSVAGIHTHSHDIDEHAGESHLEDNHDEEGH